MCTPTQCPVFYTSCMGFNLCLKILATLSILSRLLAIFFLLRHGVDVAASIWPSFCFFSDFLCAMPADSFLVLRIRIQIGILLSP
jgi:hypothetical protein